MPYIPLWYFTFENEKSIIPSTINSHILYMWIFSHSEHFIYWPPPHLSNLCCTSFVNYISCHFSHVQREPYFLGLENYAKLPDDHMYLIYHIQTIILQCPMQYFHFTPYSLLWPFQSKNDWPIFLNSSDAHIWWMCIISCYLHFIQLDQSHLSNIWHTSFVMPFICILSNFNGTHSYTYYFELKLGMTGTHHNWVPII